MGLTFIYDKICREALHKCWQNNINIL